MSDNPCTAYFKVTGGGGQSDFFILLSDLDRLDAVQNAISAGALCLSGEVVARRAKYNADWKFHLKPETISISATPGLADIAVINANPTSFSGTTVNLAAAEAIVEVPLLTTAVLPFSQSPGASSYWNLRLIEAEKALNKLPKKNGVTDWGSIKAGHIDTGYVAHEVFGTWQGAAAADGGNTRTNKTIRWPAGRDFMDGDSNPEDPLTYVPMRLPPDVPGHGLRTGSVLAGGKIGAAPGLPVVPCRAVRSVVLMTDAARRRVADSIDHLVAAGCQVISISLGWMSGSAEMGRALDRAYMAGVIVCAAGGQYTDTVTYPGRYFRAIGVGGVQPKDRKIPAANAAAANFKLEIYTECVRGGTRHIAGDDQFIDIWAPSACIDRAVAEAGSTRNMISTDGGGDGTSYGTVHVAATAAMWLRLKAANIGAKYGAGNWRRVEAFRHLLHTTETRKLVALWAPNQPIYEYKHPWILNLPAILDADLPDIADDHIQPRAEDQGF